jgi:hypothetical protein
MRNFRLQNTMYFLLILFFVGCEENSEIEQRSNSLIGYWINPQTTDSLVTYSKSTDLVENNYGIAFHSDGTLIERKNSGWCATPPISYSDFEGSWEKTDSIISILVDYWGGLACYKWKVIDLKEEELIVYKIKEESNYKTGTLKDISGLDGCGWVIELDDESKLEPINLDAFDLELEENKEIIFKYHQRTDLGSYCMVGIVVEIDEIIGMDKLSCDQKVIISPEEYENAPNDPFSITEITISGNCLNIRFSASGCDGNTWIVKLIDSGNVAESYPCQRTLRLSLDNKEICTAVPGKEISFDISDLQIVDSDKVILQISGEAILYKY